MVQGGVRLGAHVGRLGPHLASSAIGSQVLLPWSLGLVVGKWGGPSWLGGRLWCVCALSGHCSARKAACLASVFYLKLESLSVLVGMLSFPTVVLGSTKESRGCRARNSERLSLA